MMRTVGQNIAELRHAAGMSQRGLAAVMQAEGHAWHHTTVSRIENDKQEVTWAELEPLQRLLGGSIFEGTAVAEATGTGGLPCCCGCGHRKPSADALTPDEIQAIRDLLDYCEQDKTRRAPRLGFPTPESGKDALGKDSDIDTELRPHPHKRGGGLVVEEPLGSPAVLEHVLQVRDQIGSVHVDSSTGTPGPESLSDTPTVEAPAVAGGETGGSGNADSSLPGPHPIVAAVINNRDVLEDAAVDYRGGTEIRAALDLLVRLADAAKATGVPGVGLAASTPVRVITDDGDPRPIGTLAEVLAWQRIAAWAEAHRALIAAAPGLFGGLLELVEQAERATDERIKASS